MLSPRVVWGGGREREWDREWKKCIHRGDPFAGSLFSGKCICLQRVARLCGLHKSVYLSAGCDRLFLSDWESISLSSSGRARYSQRWLITTNRRDLSAPLYIGSVCLLAGVGRGGGVHILPDKSRRRDRIKRTLQRRKIINNLSASRSDKACCPL